MYQTVVSWSYTVKHILVKNILYESARLFKSCRFITIMHTRLKVPAKNSPALLFLSRGKEEERKTTTISCFYPAEEEQSRQIFGGNFQTRAHDGNKAAGLKVATLIEVAYCSFLWFADNIPYFAHVRQTLRKCYVLEKLTTKCLEKSG